MKNFLIIVGKYNKLHPPIPFVENKWSLGLSGLPKIK